MAIEKIKYWAYIHSNGELQVKRYFHPMDLIEAQESPFVKKVLEPIFASSWQEALKIYQEQIPEQMDRLEFYRRLCGLQAKFIQESPCDPDMTRGQLEAWKELQEFKRKHQNSRHKIRENENTSQE